MFCIKHCRQFTVFIALVLLSACASNPYQNTQDADYLEWKQSILSYQHQLDKDHPHQVDALFKVSDTMRETVRRKFSGQYSQTASKNLASWLIDPDGHGMRYELGANLTPIQAFKQRRGNCLSFTVLLVSLAQELDIELRYNEVDLPDVWDLDEKTGLIFYRHVNAILKTNHQKQVFDLAMSEYDARFPQRFINKDQVGALLHSNFSVDALKEKHFGLALHHIKLSISFDPKNPDLWINLGAIYKQQNNFKNAERAFTHALTFSDKNGLAASNLERLNRLLGNTTRADYFKKLAYRNRQNNPYIHYNTAKQQLKSGDYKRAKKTISRAKRLHDQDPRFYELSSRIQLSLKNYIAAFKDLQIAHTLADSRAERGRYASKLRLVIKKAQESKPRVSQNQRYNTATQYPL